MDFLTGVWSSVDANADDSDIYVTPSPKLPDTVWQRSPDGRGMIFVEPAGVGAYVIAMRITPGPGTSFAFDLGLRVDSTLTPVSVLIAARAAAMTGDPGEWADGIYQAGMEVQLADGALDLYTLDTTKDSSPATTRTNVWTDPVTYSGESTHSFRYEIIGSTRNLYVNGALRHTDTDTDSGWDERGDVYLFFALDTTAGNTLVVTNPPVFAKFWRNFVLTTEVA